MTTPNIEDLIEDLRDLIDLHTHAYITVNAAADLLQSQAERMAVLERESETHAKAYGLAIVERDNLRHELKTAQEGWRCECSTDDACRFARERDALRAELAAIDAAEPVCLIPDYELDYMQTHACGAVYKIGSDEAWDNNADIKLFTRPMPAQDVTELVEALQLFADALPLERSTIKTCYAVTDQMRDAAHAALSKYKGAK